MVRGTIVLPFTNKHEINEKWADNFISNHGLDPVEWKMIIFDTTDEMTSQHIGIKLTMMGWNKFKVLAKLNRYDKPGKRHYPHYLKMGTAIGHIWNETREHIEGDLVVMIEDDIMIPNGGIEALIHDLHHYPECGIVGAVQRFKPPEQDPKTMLAWIKREPVHDDDFKHDTPMIVGATATGLVVTYADLYKVADMSIMTYEYHASQDIAYCLMLKQLYGLTAMVDPRVEVGHLTKRGVMRGNQKTPIYPDINKNSPTYKKVTPYKAKPHPNTAPIFICGFSGRSGTTWIQRILMSHPEIMMYGEPHGAIRALFNAADKLFNISHMKVVMNSKERYNEFKAGGFIPNLGPKFANRIAVVRAKLMQAFYGAEASNMWGIKTIDLNPDQIIQLWRSFPNARFIFITRDLKKLKPSFEGVGEKWWDTSWEEILKHIQKMNHFMENYLPIEMNHFHISHSEWENNTKGMCEMLEMILELEVNTLSREVANLRLSFTNDEGQTLL